MRPVYSNRAACGVALFVLVVAVMSIFALRAQAGMRQDKLMLVTASGERTIAIEIAESAQEKALGLMFRTSLADGHGMLFPYDTPQDVTMWMRNTYIPLDMVFIRGDGTVHRIEAGAEPMSERVISAGAPVTAVLELAAGSAARLGLKPGDKVRYKHFKDAK